ncbi:diacylglycerol kinase [Clostridium bowmanii]|uniref:diacylglycerol kinase n=1 Tax=Clostridium bowmanii TaxID=132925 RepID=UPI001C0C0C73|nr:diacylglycerol kinase [Clostridium bowmanii]MBU3189698.1 diacylglycerol kinase [Clostridium bowmanii]MCA1074180.1 diacylglycerol kinase [Clostridium bowmanii]
MKVKKLVDSFNYAIEGIIYSIRTQRNMKVHMIVTILVLTASFFFDLSKVELLILTITITLVIVAEMINTAVECAIDATTNFYHPLAKIAKNVAAGAVLVTAINSVLVGYVIFWDKLTPFNITMMSKLRKSNPNMTFLILVIVCIAAVVVKSIYGEGTPFRGGMPSGHSTIAFSVATAMTLLTNEPLIMVLSYLLAVIVAQSRVDSQIHSILEVIFGAAFGTLLTLLLFKVLG